MGLFSKKCEYCRIKIDKGKEVRRNIKFSDHIEACIKNFCCEDHADKFEQEMKKYAKKQKKSCGDCCG